MRKRASFNKRILSGIMVLVMILFVFFSVAFLAMEADHECSGDNCPVCTLIQICESNLKQLGSGNAAETATAVLLTFTMLLTVVSVGDLTVSTPVSKKTRLNN